MRFRIKHLILIFVLLIPLWSYVWWRLSEEKPINIYILDKTVSTFQRNEHIALNWILNQYKYTKANKECYDPDTDYDGFYPLPDKKFYTRDLDSLKISQIDSLAKQLDCVYYADLYGIYYNEWFLDRLENEHSRLIYGGMNANEYYLLKKMKEEGKLIITEFNMIASPTSNTLRKKTESLFDIEWSGWTCRYFDLLDSIKNPEIPLWVKRLYKEQNQGNWPFKKSGIVFVHEDERIVILENQTHLIDEVPFILTSDYGRTTYHLPKKVHYPYWIDITYSGQSNRVVSNYQLKPNQKGHELLIKEGIPENFPALVEHLGEYNFYYFCGDFADHTIKLSSSYYKGISALRFLFYSNLQVERREKFFWVYYRPLMKEIFEMHLN